MMIPGDEQTDTYYAVEFDDHGNIRKIEGAMHPEAMLSIVKRYNESLRSTGVSTISREEYEREKKELLDDLAQQHDKVEVYAKLAYTVYLETVGGVSVTGARIPTWDENTNENVKNGWRQAIMAVLG